MIIIVKDLRYFRMLYHPTKNISLICSWSERHFYEDMWDMLSFVIKMITTHLLSIFQKKKLSSLFQ